MYRKKLCHFGNTRRHSYNHIPPKVAEIFTAYLRLLSLVTGNTITSILQYHNPLSASRMATSHAVCRAGAPRRSARPRARANSYSSEIRGSYGGRKFAAQLAADQPAERHAERSRRDLMERTVDRRLRLVHAAQAMVEIDHDGFAVERIAPEQRPGEIIEHLGN
jgi:hypothetical protein